MNKTLNVCRKNGKPRLWIEGATLARAGWNRGDHYDLSADGATITLSKAQQGRKKVSGRSRNGNECPIIDIVGRDVMALDSFSEIEINFAESAISVKGI